MFSVLAAIAFVPVAFAQTKPRSPIAPNVDPSRKATAGPSIAKSRLKKAPAKVEDPRQKVINDLFYDPAREGSRLSVLGQYSFALDRFERCTKNAHFIPPDVFDFEGDHGAAEWGAGFDVRLFYMRYSLDFEGKALASLGRYDEAETVWNRSYSLTQAREGDKPSHSASCCLHGLAFLAAARGRYDQSANLFRNALDQYRDHQMQEGRPMPADLNWFTMGLADAELAAGNLANAEKLLDMVLLRQEVEEYFKTGPSPSSKATRLILTAYLRRLQGRSSAALDLYGDALTICRTLGEARGKTNRDHPLTAFALDGLAELSLERKHLDSAEELYGQSLAIREKTLGAEYRDVAQSLVGLGRVANARGRDQAADSYFDRASAILVKQLNADHPDIRELELHRKGESVKVAQAETTPDKSRKTRRANGNAGTNRFLVLPTILQFNCETDMKDPPEQWPRYAKVLQRRRAVANPKQTAAKTK